MEIAKKFKVQVQKDHLTKVASGKPKAGLSELIWNALDADATNIDINFFSSELGVNKVIVSDDGDGIRYEDAESLFVGLGGSWKSSGKTTKNGRFLHGQEGQGRFKAFTIGRVADWKVVYKENDKFYEYTIEGTADAMDEFALSPKKETTKNKTGVVVEITEIFKKFHILDQDKALEELTPVFALYLKNYSSISIRVNNKRITAEQAIKESKIINLPDLNIDNENIPVSIELVEWLDISEREIWFADSNGFPLESYEKQLRGIGDSGFSAYLKSDYFRKLNNQGLLSLRDLGSDIRKCCEAAFSAIKEHFLHKTLKEAEDQINKWKVEEVYPYQGEPSDSVESAERKVFDIVAININNNLPDFKTSNKKSKQFQLRMLKQAIEKSPEDLQTILTEVLNLSRETREDLTELLQGTSLSSIINASKVVSDRLKLITGLEQLVFNHKSTLKERSQLHRIVAKNTWLFGEEFTLSVDDQALTEVLKKHASYLDTDVVIDSPVTRVDGRKGIVDLMLSRQIPTNRSNELEHLVVELKAPKVNIGKKEIDQIEGYAFAVTDDERFRNLKAKWDFWIISNDLDSYAKRKLEGDGGEDGVIYKSTKDIHVTIWIKTWSQLFAENKHRLEFLREKLNFNVDKQSAIKHLQSTYSEYIKGVKIDELSE